MFEHTHFDIKLKTLFLNSINEIVFYNNCYVKPPIFISAISMLSFIYSVNWENDFKVKVHNKLCLSFGQKQTFFEIKFVFLSKNKLSNSQYNQFLYYDTHKCFNEMEVQRRNLIFEPNYVINK